MRQIESSAQDLGPKIETHVANDPAFVRAWEAWDRRWTEFYQKYQTDAAKAGAIFYTDDLDRQVEAFRKEFLDFYGTYPSKLQANGQPVPRPAAPPPLPGERPPRGKDDGGWSLPWWVWVLGGVALVGAGYWGYLKYVELTAKRRAIETRVLPRLIGPELAEAATAGDYPAPHRSPRSTRNAEALPLEYRPYRHPHLVPASNHEIYETNLLVAGDRR